MKLFEKVQIGTLELSNRIVFPPAGSLMTNEEGVVTQNTVDYYTRLASGGAGMIEVEGCTVDPEQLHWAPGLKLSDDRYIEGVSRLAVAIKEQGARAAIQLSHPGRNVFAGPLVQPVAPSPVLSPMSGLMARELSLEEIPIIVERFGQAARRVKEAGFNAVDVHGGHGYLIASFLSPLTNKRVDGYGGDTQQRARFAVEVARCVRENVGRDFPIIFRISGDEHVEGGLTINETKIIARLLEEAGVDVISVSAGITALSTEWIAAPMLLPRGCLVPLAAEIRKVVGIAVMVANRINDPQQAETILQEGKADLIAMCRALLADPDLPRKAMEGRFRDIRRCIACVSCGPPIRCLMNPEIGGREGQSEALADKPKKVLVIGAQPAALEAARVSVLRGHEVTLWDENETAGGRWSWLIKPYLKDRLDMLKNMKVDIKRGEPITREAVDRLHPEVVMVTPRSTPIMPEIPGIEQSHVLTADDVLNGKVEVGRKVVILGAGNMGLETADFLRRKGIDVTAVDSEPAAGHGLDLSIARVMAARLSERAVKILTSTQLVQIEHGHVICKDVSGELMQLEADNVIVALGSRPTNELLELLKGGDFDILELVYCERPVKAIKIAQAGMAAARSI